MQRENNIDFDRLEIRPIKLEEDDISKLDCTEPDDSDPLGIQDYLKNKVRRYHREKTSTVYIVKQEDRILAFFTLSMAGLESKELPESNKVGGYSARYPAVLLGQMGIDKALRRKGLGQLICDYCIGLAEEVSEHIACRYIILQTKQHNIDFYRQKCGFQQSVKANPEGKFWMYRRLSIDMAQVITENVAMTESVIWKRNSDKDTEKAEDYQS